MSLVQLVVVACIFITVFSALALLLTMFGGKKDQSSKPASLSLGLNASVPGVATGDAVQDAEAARAKRKEEGADLKKDQSLSAVPWLNKILQEWQLSALVKTMLYQANIGWTPGKFMLIVVLMFFASFTLTWLKASSFMLSVVVGILIGAVPVAYLQMKRLSRFAKFEAEFPAALDLIVSALRAGHSLNSAFGLIARESPAPISTEFQICFAEQNFGLELREALDNLLVRMPLPDLRIAAAAILIQKETGGNLAEVLSNTAHLIRERFRLKKQIKVHTAHGRMTAWVIIALPFFLLGVLYLFNPALESILWTTDAGRKASTVALTMMALGIVIIRYIVNAEV